MKWQDGEGLLSNTEAKIEGAVLEETILNWWLLKLRDVCTERFFIVFSLSFHVKFLKKVWWKWWTFNVIKWCLHWILYSLHSQLVHIKMAQNYSLEPVTYPYHTCSLLIVSYSISWRESYCFLNMNLCSIFVFSKRPSSFTYFNPFKLYK